MPSAYDDLLARMEQVNAIGIALSAEKNTQRVLEIILEGAQSISNADAGTIYIRDGDVLHMEILRNNSLCLAFGGSSGRPTPFPPISLYEADGTPNERMIVTHCVLHDKTVNIADAYNTRDFDFSGTRQFDEASHYHSRSFITIPMKNHENDIIGVLQLINAINPTTGKVTVFSDGDQHLAESLASQAAVALTNKNLISDLRNLFDSFVRLIAVAIDEKSPYTGGHCQRLPTLTMMLADAVHKDTNGPFQEFRLDENSRQELELAAWLHDCGKVTTPDYVLDKATKLETIYDRIKAIDLRYEIIMHDATIEWLKNNATIEQPDDSTLKALFAELEVEKAFLHKCNIGGEYMSSDNQQRVRDIGVRRWNRSNGQSEPLLTEDEIYNLCIPKGTINSEERSIINNHVSVSIKMLNSLIFPKHLRNIPEYAGGHHERMDGKGYPNGLTREQMSVQARMMAIADIFEALTDGNRPYKKAMKLSQALRILGEMKLDSHIDPDLFDIFIREKIYMQYADKFLKPEQIDDVTVANIPGYDAR